MARCPQSGSVCSEMSGNGQTRATAPSDTGPLINQIMMESVHCAVLLSKHFGTEVVLTLNHLSVTMVSILRVHFYSLQRAIDKYIISLLVTACSLF